MPTWNEYLDEQQPRFLAELLDFLRIPSISASSVHAPDVQRAGEWVAARVRAAGLEHVQILAHGRPPGRGRRLAACAGQADGDDLRALRCAAGGPARAVDRAAVRSASARRQGVRARRHRRQGQHAGAHPGDRGAAARHRQAARECEGLLRGTGGDRQPAVGRVRAEAQGAARLRHGVERGRLPVEHDATAAAGGPARRLRHPARREGGVDRSALRHVRRHGAEPDSRARRDHRIDARCRGPHHRGRVLRRRPAAHAVAARADRARALRRGGRDRHSRRARAARRGGLQCARARVGAADARGERHRRRLPGRGHQDRAAE